MEIRWYQVEFKIEKDNTLFLLQNAVWTKVVLKPCFPKSHPTKYFSVRDDKDKEISLLETLETLDDDNRSIVEDYLKVKTFSFEIVGIHNAEEEFGVRHWDVKTKQGERSFQTELDAWPQIQDDGRIIIDDLYGDQYIIRNLEFGHKILNSYVE